MHQRFDNFQNYFGISKIDHVAISDNLQKKRGTDVFRSSKNSAFDYLQVIKHLSHMKMHFVDFIQIFVDGKPYYSEKIGGSGNHDPNITKKEAEKPTRIKFPQARVTSVITEHRPVTKEEYAAIMGAEPPWLQGNTGKD